MADTLIEAAAVIRDGRDIAVDAVTFLRPRPGRRRQLTTYEALLDQVWIGRNNSSWKVVRAFVTQLRAKLGDDAASPAWIFNVCGVGYRMPRPGEVPEA